MDTKTVIIEDSRNMLSKAFNCQSIAYGNQTDDQLIHEWLIPKLKELNNLEKIIISLRLGLDDIDFKGLRIGLHIRLTAELEQKRYLPLIFLAEDSKELILTNQIKGNKELTALLLFTPGVYLSSITKLTANINRYNETINQSILMHSVLPYLIVENQRDLGHQVANEWGVFRLARFAGIELNHQLPADLYFKYKLAFSDAAIEPEMKLAMGQLNYDCNAILIDDNADIGWSELLKNLIEKWIVYPGRNCHLQPIKTFEEAYKIEDYSKFDIVFLDLRLKPEEDKPNTNLPIEKFSGFKLLQKIKTLNKGIQVIILTASNKAWNMAKLLKEGADGYYIKESPEYNFSDAFSQQNYTEFKKTIERCLKRKHLRDVYKHWLEVMTTSNDLDADFISESNSMLEVAWSLINEEKNDFTFLTLFQILENYADSKYNQRNNTLCVSGEFIQMIEEKDDVNLWKLKHIKEIRNGDYFANKTFKAEKSVSPTTLFKVSCLLAFGLKKDDAYLKHFGKLNKIRNYIAHQGAKGFANHRDIIDLLEIIALIRGNSNIT